ncbi:hypothetical protein [Engelhardtia mirabilis]|uniref:HEAT repeat protein n=1 Tax=Engelhardtia mirabilis TaxID=2528011 RepID=A0A518BND1_9BACT|nr:hypothetical protein Pla133_35860 [Planctomycetes bacterium Pla133]QDV02813.1 hypothetical protein Pla86_35840 [Planctomycetes bacterium Pla86]
MRALILLPVLLVASPSTTQARTQETSAFQVVLVADPRADRTVQLAELFSTRFGEIEVRRPAAWISTAREHVYVFDGDLPLPRPDRWRHEGRPVAGEFDHPCVFIGAMARRAVDEWGLVGGEQAAVADAVWLRAQAQGPRTEADPAPARAPGSFTPLAFGLEGCPEADRLAGSVDAEERPVAVAWHQGRYFSFGPAAPVQDLDGGARELLLDLVEMAGGCGVYIEGKPLVADAPGLGALAELAWELDADTFSRPRVDALLAPDSGAPETREDLRRWFGENRGVLSVDESGRLAISEELRASGCGPLDDVAFVDRLIEQLADDSLRVRERTRRLLGRHVKGGPTEGASQAAWLGWREDWRGHLAFAPATQRWYTDEFAKAFELESAELTAADRRVRRRPAAAAAPAKPVDVEAELARLSAELRFAAANGTSVEPYAEILKDLAAVEGVGAPEARTQVRALVASGVQRDRDVAAFAVAFARDDLASMVDEWAAGGELKELALDAAARSWTLAGRLAATIRELAADPQSPLSKRAVQLLPNVDGEAQSLARELLTEGDLWTRRALAFEYGTILRSNHGARAALREATTDADAWVRALATWSLRNGAPAAADVEQLELSSGSHDRVVSAIAAEVLRHGSPRLGNRMAAYLDSIDGETQPRTLATASLDASEAADRWAAARDLAASRGRELLDAMETDPEASELVLRIEYELEQWIDDLCERMDDEFGEGPATRRLAELGRTALPELEHEFTRPYRFPIGPPSYDELFIAVEKIGPDAWPIAVSAFWHWREHGLWNARGLFAKLGDNTDLVAPFAAMAFVRDALLRDRFTLTPEGEFENRRWWHEYSEAWLDVWRGLGEDGLAALDELTGHPDPRVTEAVAALRRRLED